jgi:hypothetical protein
VVATDHDQEAPMALDLTTDRTRDVGLKRPAVLLTSTLAAFAAYLTMAVVTLAPVVDTSADLTPQQLDDLGASWFGLHLLWALPPVLAAVGLAMLARRLPAFPRAVTALAGVTAACAAAYLVVNLLAYRSDAPTWGDSALYPWSVSLSLAAGWLGALPATVIVGTALARRGIARRTAGTVVALTSLYWAADVAVYLPVLLGPETFAEHEGGLPPLLLGFFWAALGGGLLRSRVPSQE